MLYDVLVALFGGHSRVALGSTTCLDRNVVCGRRAAFSLLLLVVDTLPSFEMTLNIDIWYIYTRFLVQLGRQR
jgi:hypothetical protein